MAAPQLLDAASRRRSPATVPVSTPVARRGTRVPLPADPPRVEEIIAVMRQAGESDHGPRVRALIVVLWRAGLRIGEAMALTEPDLDPGRGSLLVRQGKGGKRREVGMDDWGFEQLRHARPSARDAGRHALLRDRWSDPREALDARGRAQPPATRRNEGRRPPPVRPAPLAPRPCSRDGTRARSLECDPARARPCQPWHHVGLSRRDRYGRDHRHGPQSATTDDLRQPRIADLKPA